MKFTKSNFLIIFAAFASIQVVAQTTYTSISDGDWDSPGTWSPTGTPNFGAGDKAIIENDVTKTGNQGVLSNASLTIRAGGSFSVSGNLVTGNYGSPELIVEPGGLVNVGGDFRITGAETVSINGTLNATNFNTSGGGGGPLNIGGQINLSGFFQHNVARTLTLNNGNITTGGDFVLGSSSAIFNTTGATIDVGGNLLVQGSAQFNHASDSLRVAGDFVNTGSVGVDFFGRVDIEGGAFNIGSSNMTFNGPTTIGSLTGTGATQVRVNSELLVEGDINIAGSADIVGSAGGILGWEGTFTTDNSGSRMSCANGTEYDTDAGSVEPVPPFNPVDLADCGEGEFDVLPIELSFFKGQLVNGSITLNWVTLIEENNDYFTILRSEDGYNFTPVGTLPGAGNSNNPINYQFIDGNIGSGVAGYYYQLSQTDYDGSSSSSSIIYVPIQSNDQNLAWIKNPATDNEVIITLLNPSEFTPEFVLYNALGVTMEIGQIKNIGNRKFILTFNQPLNSGLYILSILHTLKEEHYRVIVK